MADNNNILKSHNWKYVLTPYVAMNVVAFFFVVPALGDGWLFPSAMVNSVAFSVMIGILALAMNNIFSAGQKATLVFWRVRNPLPGSRAFSHFMYIDPRIDPKELENRFGPLPSCPDQQNRLWYKIYSKHKADPSILDAHRTFLAMRDLASLTLVFLVALLASWLCLEIQNILFLTYASVLVALYVVISHAARNNGKRLVANVLARESAAVS